MEGWLTEHMNMERVHGVSQLFILRSHTGHIVLMLEKTMADMLLSEANLTLVHLLQKSNVGSRSAKQ